MNANQLMESENEPIRLILQKYDKRISQLERRAKPHATMASANSVNIVVGTGNPFDVDDPFTGTAMVYPAFADASGNYHLFGMHAGVLTWGANSDDGYIYAAAGDALINDQGFTVEAANAASADPINAYKFRATSTYPDIGGIYYYYAPDDYVMSIVNKADAFGNADATGYLLLKAYGGTNNGGVIQMIAYDGAGAQGALLTLNEIGTAGLTGGIGTTAATLIATGGAGGSIILNSALSDIDTIIKGDTVTIATFDAGLDALGVGGAAVSGYIAKFTGKVAITSDLDINTNKFSVVGSSGNTTIAGTLGVTGNVAVNTNKFNVTAASGNTTVAGTLDATGNFNVNTNKFSVVASSGNTTVAGTLGVTGALTASAGASITTGFLNIPSSGALTIAAGAITVTGSRHTVDTEASAATDDLDTINGGTAGDILILSSVNSARDVTVKDGTGNLTLAGDFLFSNVGDFMMLYRGATLWFELTRSDNA